MLDVMSPYELIHGDFKVLNIDGIKIGFGVSETTNEQKTVDRAKDIIPEIKATKGHENFDILFYAVVDIVKLRSTLIIGGPVEEELAE